jgi:hypothetical protein
MKWPAAIAFIVNWNILFLGDMLGYFGKTDNRIPIGIGAQSALAFAFLFALATLLLEPFSRLVLKQGRKAGDIKSFLLFLMLITGVMFTMISIIPH